MKIPMVLSRFAMMNDVVRALAGWILSWVQRVEHELVVELDGAAELSSFRVLTN